MADLTVGQIFVQIRSGIDLDQLTFREGNITFQNLRNINCNANPEFDNKLSDTVDENLEQRFPKEPENEEEEEHLHPLPIPGPTLTHESEPSSSNLLLGSMNGELERCLGIHLETEIEEAFRERTTPELQ